MKKLIQNVHVVTMDCYGREYVDGYVAIDGDTILYIGCKEGIPSGFKADRTLDGKGKLALPGFVNAHTHSAMSLFRGYANDIPLIEWLSNAIWPLEDRMKPKDAYWLSMLSIAEMIRSGITTFADMYMFMDQTAKAVADSGIRAVLARGLQGPDANSDERLLENRRLWEQWHGQADGRIKVMVGPHALYTCSSDYLIKCMDLAQELGVGLHIHIAETSSEVKECNAKYGFSPVQYLNNIGLFRHPVLAAHCVHLIQEDIEILKFNNVQVAHCPASNLKLGSGIAPIKGLIDSGINVALGTDSAASNNSLSIMREMGLTALINKGIYEDPTIIPARQALNMGTSDGAKALGWDDEIGSLEIGKKADIILINRNLPHYNPIGDPIVHLVYSGRDGDVDTVLVNGQIIMEDGRITTIDLNRVYYEVERIRQRIMSDSGKI
jgi:5-methylthioadenosine/S-adenosylhomocysteine deaminase